MHTLGIIGIILGFAVMGLLTYRGWHVTLSSLAGALVVALFNSIPITDAYLSSYLPGMGNFLAGYFGQFFFGALLAEVYSVTGAGLTIALGLSKTCIRDSFSPKKKRAMVLFVLLLIGAALEFAGVGASLIVMVTYPVALNLFHMTGMPKKYIIGALLGGCLGFSMSMPGAPQPANTIPMNILGTSSTAALIPGLAGAVAEIFAIVFLLNLMITRGLARGEHFDPETDLDRKMDYSQPRPAMWRTLIPIAVLFVLFNIIKWDINVCLAITLIVSVAFFYKYFPEKDIKTPAARGIEQGITATVSICAIIGFSAVVQGTVAYEALIGSLINLKMNPYLLIIVCVAFLCMLCGGSATGQAIAIPIVAPLAQKAGISAAAVHRISTFAGSTLDTMPYSGTVVMAHAYANVKVKDGYPAVFMISVIATFFSTSVVTILCALFPALAV